MAEERFMLISLDMVQSQTASTVWCNTRMSSGSPVHPNEPHLFKPGHFSNKNRVITPSASLAIVAVRKAVIQIR